MIKQQKDIKYDLPQGWKPYKLGKIVEFIGGSQPPKEEFSYDLKEGFIRLIQIRDYKSENNIVYVNKKSARRFCEEDDIMIGRYGPPVFQILRGLKGAYNVALMKAVPNQNIINKDYLFLFLQNSNIQNYIIGLSQRSAGQSGVNKEALESYDLILPPPKEQERIVAKLDAAFDKIDAAIQLTEENLLHTQNLLPSALNDVFGKAEGKGWKIKTIEQTFKIKSGEFMSAKMMTDNAKYDVYGGNGINGKHTNYNLEGENIIIGRVGAKCGNVRFVEGKVWITDNAFFVSELLTPILKEYLAILLGNMELGKTANQAAQPVISYKGIKDLKIPLPDPTIQQTIVNQLNQLSTKQQQLQQHYTQQLKQLQALKASLLDAAFKGEL